MEASRRRYHWIQHLRLFGLIALSVVALGMLVRRVISSELGRDSSLPEWWLVEEQVGLHYTRNTGAGFGVLAGNPKLLAVVSVLVAVGIVWWMHSELAPGYPRSIAAGLVVGGATANLIERLWYGYVTDYVAVGPWPRFNVADSAITTGLALFVVYLMTARSSTVEHLVSQPNGESHDGTAH